jgi:hypothetical protein
MASETACSEGQARLERIWWKNDANMLFARTTQILDDAYYCVKST